MTDFKPGLYRHFKGGRYRALMLARLESDREVEAVIYISLTHQEPYPHQVWVRPLAHGDTPWIGAVEWPDGITRPRFIPEEEAAEIERMHSRQGAT